MNTKDTNRREEGASIKQTPHGGLRRKAWKFALTIIFAMTCSFSQAASPLLLVTDAPTNPNPFAGYLAEILRGEGFTTFDEVAKGELKVDCLVDRAAVLLTETRLDAKAAGLLREHVKSGGLLVAMRPDAALHEVFGIRDAGRFPDRLRQYVVVPPKLPHLEGFDGAVLQYHGPATQYALRGATAVAWLRDDPKVEPSEPAITIHRFGRGTAIAFAFDLAKNVVLTRQGNPDWAGDEGDAFVGYRPMDSFQRLDGRTWYDIDRVALPHADELQRIFGRLILRFADRPLPKLWPLPKTHDVIVANTGDGESDYASLLDSTLDACAAEGGAFSVYLMTPGIAKTPPEHEARWRKAGHETGIHFYAGGKEGAGAEPIMRKAFTQYIAAFKNAFGHPPRTIRNHTIDWTGWVDMAAIEADHGLGMDGNYYHYLMQGDPRKHAGTFTGTTLPQRMMDEKGRLLSIYQATTQMCDEWFDDKLLTPAETLSVTKGMIAAARKNGYPSAFVVNIHPVRFRMKDDITSKWIVPFWKYLKEDGIPSWSAEMLLDFVTARNASKMESVRWKENADGGGTLTFRFVPGATRDDLTFTLPVKRGETHLESVSVEGKKAEPVVREIKEVETAFVTLPASDVLDVSCVYVRP